MKETGVRTYFKLLFESKNMSAPPTNIKIIQEIMGHADITTTMDIYNEATLDKKKESFANLEGKIKLS